MKRKIAVVSGVIVFALLCCIAAANAHEFIIKPVQVSTEAGNKLPFSVLAAHVFMISEEAEPIEQVEISLIEKENKSNVELRENPIFLTLDGAVEPKKEGTAIIAGHRKGMIWSQTTQGWKQAGKKELKGVISSGKYEKFCKTLINVGKADDGYKKVVGHKLEIVPVSNPAEAMIGKDMEFKILFDGKPFSTSVYATYDGFSTNPNTYAYFTETNEEGIAKVKITHPGVWMVRVEKEIAEPTEDYDNHVIRAVLVLGVN